jgi:hypothetical protein
VANGLGAGRKACSGASARRIQNKFSPNCAILRVPLARGAKSSGTIGFRARWLRSTKKEIRMSDPRAPHDPRDPRAPNDPLAPHTTRPAEPHRAGAGTAMPTWGWAAIAGVVLLLAVLFMWPTGTTQQADLETRPTETTPPVSSPASPPQAQPAPPADTPPAQTPPAQSPPAQ